MGVHLDSAGLCEDVDVFERGEAAGEADIVLGEVDGAGVDEILESVQGEFGFSAGNGGVEGIPDASVAGAKGIAIGSAGEELSRGPRPRSETVGTE
nr:hypothetical protein [Paenarthrobacter nitroguajacolicus]